LNGKDVPTGAGNVRLSTAKEIETKAGPRQTADQPVSFLKLGALASVEHSLTSPSVVFLLLIVGLSLMVFEFFTVGIGLAGVVGGMPVAVRNRFSIPTVGRDSMIGELGEARTDLNPDGVVTVRGAPWRARTGRGRPVSKGGAVRVVAVDRLVLEVEPGEAAVE